MPVNNRFIAVYTSKINNNITEKKNQKTNRNSGATKTIVLFSLITIFGIAIVNTYCAQLRYNRSAHDENRGLPVTVIMVRMLFYFFIFFFLFFIFFYPNTWPVNNVPGDYAFNETHTFMYGYVSLIGIVLATKKKKRKKKAAHQNNR